MYIGLFNKRRVRKLVQFSYICDGMAMFSGTSYFSEMDLPISLRFWFVGPH